MQCVTQIGILIAAEYTLRYFLRYNKFKNHCCTAKQIQNHCNFASLEEVYGWNRLFYLCKLHGNRDKFLKNPPHCTLNARSFNLYATPVGLISHSY